MTEITIDAGARDGPTKVNPSLICIYLISFKKSALYLVDMFNFNAVSTFNISIYHLKSFNESRVMGFQISKFLSSFKVRPKIRNVCSLRCRFLDTYKMFFKILKRFEGAFSITYSWYFSKLKYILTLPTVSYSILFTSENVVTSVIGIFMGLTNLDSSLHLK